MSSTTRWRPSERVTYFSLHGRRITPPRYPRRVRYIEHCGLVYRVTRYEIRPVDVVRRAR